MVISEDIRSLVATGPLAHLTTLRVGRLEATPPHDGQQIWNRQQASVPRTAAVVIVETQWARSMRPLLGAHHQEPQCAPSIRRASAPICVPLFWHARFGLLTSFASARLVENGQPFGARLSVFFRSPFDEDCGVVVAPIARPAIPHERHVAAGAPCPRLETLEDRARVTLDHDEGRRASGLSKLHGARGASSCPRSRWRYGSPFTLAQAGASRQSWVRASCATPLPEASASWSLTQRGALTPERGLETSEGLPGERIRSSGPSFVLF